LQQQESITEKVYKGFPRWSRDIVTMGKSYMDNRGNFEFLRIAKK